MVRDQLDEQLLVTMKMGRIGFFRGVSKSSKSKKNSLNRSAPKVLDGASEALILFSEPAPVVGHEGTVKTSLGLIKGNILQEGLVQGAILKQI